MSPYRIAITPGEPAGIGPDLAIKLAQQPSPAELIAIADPDVLQQRAKLLNLSLQLSDFNPDNPIQPNSPGELKIIPISTHTPTTPGQLNPNNASYVIESLQIATQMCLDKTVHALVTGPVHKANINASGMPFTGHTEYLAELTNTKCVVMLLITDKLCVALVTTHLPLAQVPAAINQEDLQTVLEIVHQSLIQDFALSKPRMAVCGLNPHAGEQGHLGREEIDIIQPVIETLQAQGMAINGPVSADTAFVPSQIEKFDVIVAMYHDQGLPVLKHAGFGHAVNITLGLPIIRTSVDHGTALSLAGTGNIDCGSMQAAINVAIKIAGHRYA